MSYPSLTDVEQAKAFLSQYADATPPPKEGTPVGAPQPKVAAPRFNGRVSKLPASIRSKLVRIRRLANEHYPGYTPEQIKLVREAFSVYDMYINIKDTPLWTDTNSRGVKK